MNKPRAKPPLCSTVSTDLVSSFPSTGFQLLRKNYTKYFIYANCLPNYQTVTLAER